MRPKYDLDSLTADHFMLQPESEGQQFPAELMAEVPRCLRFQSLWLSRG
jgi:hypothetical protein